MSDEPDRQDLEDRVDQLESTISKMLPSRRDALKLGGAALVGGAAMSGSASAGTQQAGTIGTANDPVDVESEDINNADTVTTQDLAVNGSIDGINSPQDNRVFTTGNLNDPNNVSITGLSVGEDEAILLNIRGQGSTSGGQLFMTVNNTTSDYKTFHIDGTESSSPGFELFDSTGETFGHTAGQIKIFSGGAGRVGALGPFAPAQFSRVSRTLLTGGRDQGTFPINSVEFSTSSGFDYQIQVSAHVYSLF